MVKCPYCPRKFRANAKLEKHVESRHSDSRIRKRIALSPTACPLCDRKFKNIHAILTHIRRSKDKKHKVNYDVIKKLYVEYAESKDKTKKIISTSSPKVYPTKPTSVIKRIFGFGNK